MPDREIKASIAVLKGESNYKSWRQIIHLHLEWHGIEKYVNEDVPEPDDPDKKKEWNKDCVTIRIMFSESLVDPKISAQLHAVGLDEDEKNPYIGTKSAKSSRTRPTNPSESISESITTSNARTSTPWKPSFSKLSSAERSLQLWNNS
ncbi:hypothetical protein B0T25DRAFT_513245 [Lasiosphaeria hispida]|uniref:Uncharacterized protein n=1 Tax=Lasiosphaeria hispida TaxID=260671 RepID=A0AAJ0MJV9_9PEZI|nr:hypothetical protein B0T25DRAFT_513245 [Lasiosphaeria hispida]